MAGNLTVVAAAAIALGGCLWWVAQRQVGGEPAALVLALYVSTPAVLRSPAACLPALGLFAMLYTAVGVAHALAGPRRKWPGRIGLMAAACTLTGWAQPLACAAGLVLALVAMLFLMEGQRRLLPLLFLLWGAAAWGAALLPHPWPVASVAVKPVWPNAGLVLVLVGALFPWARHRRSRYFGHSAPLLATVLIAGLWPWAGSSALLWGLPFALLFVAGVLDDASSELRGRVWSVSGWAMVAVQTLLSLRH